MHCQPRLQWRQDLAALNVLDWGRIIFNDESLFEQNPDNQQITVWRLPGQHQDPAFAVACYLAHQQRVMVWDAISWDSRTSMVILRDTLTTQRYADLILMTCSVDVPIAALEAYYSAK